MSDDCKEILAFLHEHWPKINKDADTLAPWFERKRQVARTETERDLQSRFDSYSLTSTTNRSTTKAAAAR